jgi:hypothetical protein
MKYFCAGVRCGVSESRRIEFVLNLIHRRGQNVGISSESSPATRVHVAVSIVVDNKRSIWKRDVVLCIHECPSELSRNFDIKRRPDD